MSKLYSSLTINQLTLPNRLVLPPMATGKSADSGMVTDDLCQYYDEKSRDGAIGLIITEHSYVAPEGKASKGQLSLAEDIATAGLSRLTDVIHKNHTLVFAQLNHAGGAASQSITGLPVISSSSVAHPRGKGTLPGEMTRQEIAQVIRQFADAAGRAKEAGFDGVEIHSAHGYLLNQFYSPLTNHRQDEYTGSTIQGRTRLHLEILHAVRAVVGADYPISLRLGACDYMEGGSTIEDSVAAAVLFEQAGLDLLSISGGFCGYIHPTCTDEGYFREITRAIRSQCSLPLLLTGGITSADAAEALLQQDAADLIGVGRAILRDSSWARQAMQKLGENAESGNTEQE